MELEDRAILGTWEQGFGSLTGFSFISISSEAVSLIDGYCKSDFLKVGQEIIFWK
jgi:hypothetical protein